MKAIKEKIERLDLLKNEVELIEEAISRITRRNLAGKDAVQASLKIWDVAGSNAITITNRIALDETYLDLLSKKKDEYQEEIERIEPVLKMAETVFKSQGDL